MGGIMATSTWVSMYPRDTAVVCISTAHSRQTATSWLWLAQTNKHKINIGWSRLYQHLLGHCLCRYVWLSRRKSRIDSLLWSRTQDEEPLTTCQVFGGGATRERRTVKPTRKVPHPTCKPSVLFQMFPWALLLVSFKQKTIIQRAIDDSGIRIKDQEL